MAELTRVPAPRSPFDGWRGRAVAFVVVGILLAIAKPWGGDDPIPPPRAVTTPSGVPASTPVALAPVGQPYDPAAFGQAAPAPSWALLTSSGTTPIEFVAPDPTTDPDDTIAAGPVVDLGSTADLAAIAVAHPRDVSIPTIRMWHFSDGAAPRRVDLDTVTSPWPGTPHVEVVGHRQSGMPADRVLAWEPGLYRLDLLIEPIDRVRSVMLSVDPAPSAGSDTAADTNEAPRSGASFKPSTLRLLPEAANLWSAGRFLSGWRRAAAEIGCRVAEIWRATDPGDGCWAVPLGRTEAVGVNLPAGTAVASIELRGIDPLPGPVEGTSQTGVSGRAGLALVRAPAGGLPDGIYRLDVATTTGDRLTWYLEVGPIGRAVARYYEASTGR